MSELSELRAALKPFAKELNDWQPDAPDRWRVSSLTKLTVGDLRRAKEALSRSED